MPLCAVWICLAVPVPVAGRFPFVPLLDGIDLHSVVNAARLPGSQMIPP
jgi:hypothetical protein